MIFSHTVLLPFPMFAGIFRSAPMPLLPPVRGTFINAGTFHELRYSGKFFFHFPVFAIFTLHPHFTLLRSCMCMLALCIPLTIFHFRSRNENISDLHNGSHLFAQLRIQQTFRKSCLSVRRSIPLHRLFFFLRNFHGLIGEPSGLRYLHRWHTQAPLVIP